jgi:hypothetical protein
VLDPGENADMTATFTNIGGADLDNMSTTLACTSPYITITDNSGYFGTLAIDSTKENTGDPYSVTVDNDTPHGSSADFMIYVSGSGGYADTFEFTLLLGDPVPTDTGYYYVYYSGGPHPQAPVFDWIAIDSTQTVYNGTSLDLDDNESVVVSLPFTFQYYGADYNQITICSNGWIAMGNQATNDWTNSYIPNADGPGAMIAGIWDDLDPGNVGAPSDVYYYYDSATHRFIIEYFKVEHFSAGSEETFEIILCDPNYYPTPTNDGEIYVQYLVEQQQLDNTCGIENAAENLGIQYFFNSEYHTHAMPITDQFALRYTTIPPEQTGIEEYTQSAMSTHLSVFPSVTRGHVTISYTMPGNTGTASITIHDVTGRLVRTFVDHANAGTMTWDGYDLRGQHVPSGVYFVKLNGDAQTSTAKVIVIE